jgi:hypothetical protein
MWKRILSLAILFSFLSVGFCFAFDVNSVKDAWLPKISEWWNIALNWINTDAVPWIEKNLGEKSRQEFQKEFKEALSDVPLALQNLWTTLKGALNK